MEKDQIETTPELELSKIRIRKMSNEVESLQHKLRDCQDELDSHLKLVMIHHCTSFSTWPSQGNTINLHCLQVPLISNLSLKLQG